MKWAIACWLVCAAVFGTAALGWNARVETAHGLVYPHDCDERSREGCPRDQWDFIQGQCVSWVAFRLHRLGFDNRYAGVRWGSA